MYQFHTNRRSTKASRRRLMEQIRNEQEARLLEAEAAKAAKRKELAEKDPERYRQLIQFERQLELRKARTTKPQPVEQGPAPLLEPKRNPRPNWAGREAGQARKEHKAIVDEAEKLFSGVCPSCGHTKTMQGRVLAWESSHDCPVCHTRLVVSEIASKSPTKSRENRRVRLITGHGKVKKNTSAN